MGGSGALDRRAVLLLGVSATTAACTHRSPTGAPSPAASNASTSRATSAPPALPPVTRWRPGPGELVPAAKLAAVRRIERLGDDRNHRVQVIDAQYGGLLTDAASVLVVCRTLTRRGVPIDAAGHTFDVRLRLQDRHWQVTAIHPSHPGPPTPHLTAAARHVLRSSRIALPPAARRDVGSGLVHDSVLEAMLAVARSWSVGVSVVRSGHPIFVFGTSRLSDHPRGRAFDTWSIDGHPVVRPTTPRALVSAYMEALAAAGSYNVGGPVLLGAAPQYFSDRTHHDHVHAGFTT